MNMRRIRICLVDNGNVSVHGPSIIYASGTTSIKAQRVWQSVENHNSEPLIFAWKLFLFIVVRGNIWLRKYREESLRLIYARLIRLPCGVGNHSFLWREPFAISIFNFHNHEPKQITKRTIWSTANDEKFTKLWTSVVTIVIRVIQHSINSENR